VRSLATMREVEALDEPEPGRKRMDWETSLPLHQHKKTAE